MPPRQNRVAGTSRFCILPTRNFLIAAFLIAASINAFAQSNLLLADTLMNFRYGSIRDKIPREPLSQLTA